MDIQARARFLIKNPIEMRWLGKVLARACLQPMIECKASALFTRPIGVSAYGTCSSGKTKIFDAICHEICSGHKPLKRICVDKSGNPLETLLHFREGKCRHIDFGECMYGTIVFNRCYDDLFPWINYYMHGFYGVDVPDPSAQVHLDLIEHVTVPHLLRSDIAILVSPCDGDAFEMGQYFRAMGDVFDPYSPALAKEFRHIRSETIKIRRAIDDPYQKRIVTLALLNPNPAAFRPFVNFLGQSRQLGLKRL